MHEHLLILFLVLLIGHALYSCGLKKTPIGLPFVFLAFAYGLTHVLSVERIGDRDILYLGTQAVLASAVLHGSSAWLASRPFYAPRS